MKTRFPAVINTI